MDLPDPGIEPGSPTLQADSLLSEIPGKPHSFIYEHLNCFQCFVITNHAAMSNQGHTYFHICWGVYLQGRLPRWVSGKESAYNEGDLGFDPLFGNIPWRREWQPTTVFLPKEFHGQRSLVGYSP